MFSIAQLTNIVKPKAISISDEGSQVKQFVFDSRKVVFPQESIFFAIKTKKNDGHQYIDELVSKGVKTFIVSENLSKFEKHTSTCNFLQVEDVVLAMQQIASAHRKQFVMPVIGITGSNGKTIVKEWLSSMLVEDYDIVKNPNSYNSQIGVPFSVWQMNENHNLGIFEAGISQLGEMEKIEKIIQPSIGILTNIGTAHSQFFNNQQEKLEEKLKLFKKSDSLIFCIDNEQIAKTIDLPKYSHLKKISWGKSDKAFYRITHKEIQNNFTKIEINGQVLEIPFTDAASIENAMHCAILMLHFGYSFAVINSRLLKLGPIDMRMEIKEAVNQSIVINDTYSLDFNSLRIAVDFLNLQKQFPKKCLILSDFEQTADFSKESLEQIKQILLRNNISHFIAVGKKFFENKTIFTDENIHSLFYATTEELLRDLPQITFQHEAILIKGARTYRFERVTQQLLLKTHQTVLNVNLPAIIHNLDYYRSFLKPGCKMVAMVKALSYGLGDAELINELQFHNIDYLAVAYGDEGINLRNHNIKLPIIVLGAEAHSFDLMIQHHLEPEIFNFHYLQKLIETLEQHPETKEFKIHIKLDTGMHRLGFDEEDLPQLIHIVKQNPQLHIASTFSHLAAAEDASEDEFTREQIAQFTKMSNQLVEAFDYPILRHILNSAGITRFSEFQFDMVRLGIGLYGFSGVEQDQKHLQNVATLKTIITQIKTIKAGETIGYNRGTKVEKDTQVGIIPIGYADGFFREFGLGRGRVFVNGKYARTLGKICMDMCMIDLTDIDVKIGDEVIVYGEENRIDDMAACIGRIPYDLLTSISRRVPRIYVME
ncbi:MAG: bifunctional UDP-N-acetylmuramoyl-tripeptide:D-alanyl-D-alanine ligase/alanine racemase [Bacteroidales bacterium]|nr:bifunctional UDP-N-acetylmuramoyl-tripeptide:D-alanyl-D-alanine ligase/alanine racemase [Bacteroidales bacterium]